MEKKYWKSTEELNNQVVPDYNENLIPEGKNLLDLIDEEIAQKPSSRRNFLKFCGFSFATAAIASSCENPVKKAIPYLNKPEDVTPGMASHYATSYFDGSEYNSILVKVRDGRPIKIEGNTLSDVTKGGTTARVQASVLSLYDGLSRHKSPMKKGADTNWASADAEISASLRTISAAGGTIVLLTSNIISPATKKLIEEFKAAFPGVRQVVYDPVSASGILMANRDCYGQAVIPDYLFDKAEVIASFSADFLGTWLSPVEYTARYAQSRNLTNGEKKLSYHIQFETGLTITGSKADKRVPVKPSEEAGLLLQLYNEIAAKAGQATAPAGATHEAITALAGRLWESKGKSLVVSGSNDPNQQIMVNAINQLLENNGATIGFETPLLTRQAIDNEMEELVGQMNAGSIGELILWNVNPVYDYYKPEAFISGIGKVKLTVSFNPVMDETQEYVDYILPSHHFLESWDDAEPKRGFFSLSQPTIRPLFSTRQPQESLMKWMGKEGDYYSYLKNFWMTDILKAGETEWKTTLQGGVFQKETPAATAVTLNTAIVAPAAQALSASKKSDSIEISLYQNLSMGNGMHTNNPWLMELPDPVSKICWDNFASLSQETAKALGVTAGNVLNINGLEVPVFLQPGQAGGTISIALGYGHTRFGKVADGVGVNVYPLATYENGTLRLYNAAAKVEMTDREYQLATTQMHGSMEGRPIVRETVLGSYLESPDAGNELHAEFEKKHVTLYKETEYKGHHWAMAIDLNACTGCSACVIACQAENNIPVVGKEEVMKTRIMHWIRIDRYYAGDEKNPEVVFQPLMCQHCDNAPCENVCPVSATNHSSEGLNQMAYNRCIGTKYCINNCPYKVRRFNWFRYATNQKFDYNMNDDLSRMVLNPDVTVRERGVVEKCSLCVQRIQEKKLLAKTENRPLQDGEILPACAQGCPSKAIVFGDLNDPQSRVSQLFKDPRNYHLLEELHTLPKVGYLTLVRNSDENKA
ncbi:MAG: molybdopterin oxidoreductase iron-sulfur binding subunit [Bacteroidetes bacterium]|nr:MAG: molybdopterin oxidoreductase iron-sulfur binding subunit [Bacteroidota bacterium]